MRIPSSDGAIRPSPSVLNSVKASSMDATYSSVRSFSSSGTLDDWRASARTNSMSSPADLSPILLANGLHRAFQSTAPARTPAPIRQSSSDTCAGSNLRPRTTPVLFRVRDQPVPQICTFQDFTSCCKPSIKSYPSTSTYQPLKQQLADKSSVVFRPPRLPEERARHGSEIVDRSCNPGQAHAPASSVHEHTPPAPCASSRALCGHRSCELDEWVVNQDKERNKENAIGSANNKDINIYVATIIEMEVRKYPPNFTYYNNLNAGKKKAIVLLDEEDGWNESRRSDVCMISCNASSLWIKLLRMLEEVCGCAHIDVYAMDFNLV
ncbi:hypothetical protein IEQ34_021340 [Dendrobium chrysotoxum]|uniref:Uncharacterized protein n=1 Tax=Dendrobium chrysotoxum TaxID=161865 RepID=A0AAV7G5L5_DENCH|nr:hypothetical protein IEQ34_021340 [Dendrobium chrysotoxum]